MTTTYRMLLLVAAMVTWLAPDAHARWYDPTTGRWLQRDPAGFVDGMSRYQYVVSNPLRYVDRNGWQAEEPDSQPSAGEQVSAAGGPAQQCVDDSGNPIELTFDGDTLSGEGDGTECSCSAASGKPVDTDTTREWVDPYTDRVTTTYTFDNGTQRQRKRGSGPLPSGDYWVSTCAENSAANAVRHRWYSDNWIYGMLRNGGRGSWGDYSWPLTPFPGTDVDDENGNPREGFFIHGGDNWGSAGCIDLTGDDATFHDFMESVRSANTGCCYIKVAVKYGRRFTTKTGSGLFPSPSPP